MTLNGPPFGIDDTSAARGRGERAAVIGLI
jgi:hypothetical protein